MKKILLYADSYGGRVGIAEPYVDFLSQFGEVILVTPSNDLPFFIAHADVLAMPGGADVDPIRYGEKPHPRTGRANVHFEYLDTHLLMPWLATGKPIIGICRGMQSLNVACGGSLYQDVIGHVGGERRDDTGEDLFTDIAGYELYLTNSYHHQAVKKLAPDFEIIGWSPVFHRCPSLNGHKDLRPFARHHYEKDRKTGRVSMIKKENGGVATYYSFPEIIRHREKPYIGFQYHPEEFNCRLAIMLIEQVLGVEAEQDHLDINMTWQ